MIRQGDSRSNIRGSFKRILALVMCFAVLSGMSVCLSGCSLFDGISKGFKTSSKLLSESDLALIVTNAIMDERDVSENFSKIPESQLEGLSYSVFYQYCSILRKSSNAHGTVNAFRFLDDSEKEAYFSQIDSNAGEEYATIDEYGEMDVVELCYSKDHDPKAPPVRFTIAKKDNGYSIAGRYITDSMFAYAYINHYFDMIDDGNADELQTVIKDSYDSDIYLNSVIYSKANYICDYYKLKVRTHSDDYELKLFSPTHISYLIPEVFTEYNDGFVSKTIDLRRYKSGTFCIKDNIPSSIEEIRLVKNGEIKLRLGSVYSQNEIYRLLGEPVMKIPANDVVTLAYRGMTVRLAAEIKNGKWTTGRLTSIVIHNSSEFKLGEDIYVGMNVSELLLVYPMFDQSDFQGSFKNVDGEFVIKFDFNDYGNVTKITVGEAVG